jgi:hypothetical protein
MKTEDNSYQKGMVITIICLFIMASVVPSIGMGKNNSNDKIDTTYKIRYKIEFSEDMFSFDRFMEYDVVKLRDGNFLNVVGKPMLPVENIRVALPMGMTVRQVQVVDIQSVEIKGSYSILPAQLPKKTDASKYNVSFVEPDAITYTSTQPYPSKLAQLLHQTDLAGQSIAVIQLHPLQYIPYEKKLLLYTDITLVIEGVGGYKCGDYLPRGISETKKEMYKQMITGDVVNPGDIELSFSDENDTGPQITGVNPGDYDYVIITQYDWIDDFQSLADWKTKKGVKTTIVDRDWIYSQPDYSGSDQDKIQDFIQDAHSTWGATFFLLGGDTNIIPHQTKHYYLSFGGDPAEHIYAPSDSYYGDYDQDFMCEVHVGRACVRTASAISTFISKILTYEQNPPLTNYAKKAGLFGFDLDAFTHGEIVKSSIDSNYIPSNWTVSTEYDSEGGSHESDVKNYINVGQHLINHIDHSGEYSMGVGSYWHNDYLGTSEVDAFYNGDRQSILYTTGCDPAAFDEPSCIAEHFVQDSDGGCIAFVGNSRYGVYVQGQYSSYSNLYDKEFFESIFEEGNYILGEAFSDHKNEGLVNNDYYKLIFDELNLLGDPELPIWTENPISINVTCPSTLPTGSSDFLVHVVESGGSELEGAYVCLWKDNEVYLRGYTDYNGNVTFTPAPSTVGIIYVTVTKHNYLPYAGLAQVSWHNPPFEPSSPYPGNHTMDVDVDADLSWTGGDPDGDPVTYDVYFGNVNPPPQIAWNQSATTYDPGTMDGWTHYYWKVVAWDNDFLTGSTSGPIWDFTTEDNIPPEISNVIAYPNHQVTGGYVNISCDVNDNDGIDIVKVNITDPNGGTVNVTMIGGYYYNTTYELNGSYCYFIWTNDTLGNENMSTSYRFEIGDYLHVNNPLQKWNFISLPFNQSIDKKDLIIINNGASYNWTEATDPANGPLIDSFIFGWNRGTGGQTYQAVNILEPGYGYWMYAYSDCELWTKNISVIPDNYITDLGEKWNTIGIPFDQPIDKTNLILNYNGTDYNWSEAIDPANGPLVDSFIFGWTGGPSGQTYQAVDVLEPGYSYWMYAYYSYTLLHP